jgi:hypothetical protein
LDISFKNCCRHWFVVGTACDGAFGYAQFHPCPLAKLLYFV